jgi:hypothetical protein
MATRVMNPALTECTAPQNTAVVHGILAALIASVGPDFAAKKLEDRLKAQDMCTVALLKTVTVEALILHFGMTYGEAVAVDSQIFPETHADEQEVAQVVQAVHPAAMGTRNAPEFPELGKDGLPSSRDLRAWLPGFRAHLAFRISHLALAEYDALAQSVKHVLTAEYSVVSSADSEAIMTALLTAGSKGLPSTIVLSFPPAVVSERLGLVALQHLMARVLTVTDESLGVLLKWFQSPDVVSQPWLLGLALTKWLEIRDQLSADGLPQSEIACRLSLLHLCSKLSELKAVFAALEVANPMGVPIETLITAVKARANSYSSLRGANSEVAVLAECYSAEGHAHEKGRSGKPRGYRTRECNNWKRGPCSYGDKCIFKHTGVSGQGAAADTAAVAADLGAQVKALQTQLAAIQGSINLSNHADMYRSTATDKLENQDDPKGLDSFNNNVCEALGAEHMESTVNNNTLDTQCNTNKDEAALGAPCDLNNESEINFNNKNQEQQVADILQGLEIPKEPNKPLVPEVTPLSPEVTPLSPDPLGLGLETLGGTASLAQRSLQGEGVVGDTGATLRVIGADHVDEVINIRPLRNPILLKTANSTITLTHCGDLPNFRGLMNGAAINRKSQHSLLPIIPICRELKCSFEVSVGGEYCRFKSGDECIEMEIVGNLPMLYPQVDQSMAFSNLGSEPFPNDDMACANLCSIIDLDPCTHSSTSVDSECAIQYLCHDCNVACVEPKWMLAHDMAGHRPHNPKCPYCVQAGMRERGAYRLASHDRKEGELSLAGDMSGPHDPGVTGSTWAFVGVEIISKYGFVALQESKSAADTLDSLKDFTREVKHLARADTKITEWHHDNGTEFKGVLYDWVREQGWDDTHTGGYRPNSNSFSERRIGMLHQTLRVLLLRATGGVMYYDQLWDVGLLWGNECVNTNPWSSGPIPIEVLTGSSHTASVDTHPFGAYCLYKIPVEGVVGKWAPRSEMGIWVGIAHEASHSARVVPITWDSESKCWILGAPIVATRVKVYDTLFPLSMHPNPTEPSTLDFDTFIDSVIQPLFRVSELGPEVAPVPKPAPPPSDIESEEEENWEVEKLTKRRVKLGQVQYLVKWKGFNNRHNVWRGVDQLACDDLITKYESDHASVAIEVMTEIQVASIAESQAVELFGEDDCRAREAVSRLMLKQGLEGTADSFLPGYKKEISEMLKRRLRLLGPSEAKSVRLANNLGRLRMILELKRDDRRKARLILQGFREPVEWDEGSVASPVAYPSSIRTFLFHSGPRTDVISTNDVSVAFLQSDPYSLDQAPRYVAYKAYRESIEWIFQLLGPIYGQRAASREWYHTISKWLDSVGFVQCKNEPCLFINSSTGMKVLLYVDDLIVRGSPEESTKFHDSLEQRFDCREGSRQLLTPDDSIDFTGITLTMEKGIHLDSYFLDQKQAVASFLIAHE